MTRPSLRFGSFLALVIAAGTHTRVAAQQDAANVGTKLLADAAVKAAVDAIKAAEPKTLEDQIALCEVEAPPFKEQKRAEVYARLFRAAGGGRGTGSHALDEAFDPTNCWMGTQRALLLALALAQH